jgi:hypothetical protein
VHSAGDERPPSRHGPQTSSNLDADLQKSEEAPSSEFIRRRPSFAPTSTQFRGRSGGIVATHSCHSSPAFRKTRELPGYGLAGSHLCLASARHEPVTGGGVKQSSRRARESRRHNWAGRRPAVAPSRRWAAAGPPRRHRTVRETPVQLGPSPCPFPRPRHPRRETCPRAPRCVGSIMPPPPTHPSISSWQ